MQLLHESETWHQLGECAGQLGCNASGAEQVHHAQPDGRLPGVGRPAAPSQRKQGPRTVCAEVTVAWHTIMPRLNLCLTAWQRSLLVVGSGKDGRVRLHNLKAFERIMHSNGC